MISNPSMRSVCSCRRRISSERIVRARKADPRNGAILRRGKQAQGGSGNDAQRPLGADQQLVEDRPPIVLLERGKAVVNRPVGQHRLDPRHQPAHRPEAKYLRAPGVGRDQPADSATPARRPASAGIGGRSPEAASWRWCRMTPASATASCPSIERIRFIRRSDNSNADPSAGGVAPPTMPVLPPWGTRGT